MAALSDAELARLAMDVEAVVVAARAGDYATARRIIFGVDLPVAV